MHVLCSADPVVLQREVQVLSSPRQQSSSLRIWGMQGFPWPIPGRKALRQAGGMWESLAPHGAGTQVSGLRGS